jgi:epoxyqueuosine reductase
VVLSRLTNELVIEKAKAAGFNLAGFAPYRILEEEGKHLEEWLSLKYNSGMKYMEKEPGRRIDISKVFPEVKSIISLALNYYTGKEFESIENSGKISRYAWGKDYHLIMWEMLDNLISDLKEIDPEFKALSYVDTGPVMDKAWAAAAGIGWMGKHSNIINNESGSWFFLATVITNYEFTPSQIIPDHCGTCTACIDACPTNAIVNDYVVDANRCISYLTIENKGDIPDEFKGQFDNWLFGCDICQEVCPWNKKFPEPTHIKEFYPSEGSQQINLDEIKNLSPEEFKERFSDSPLKRAKLKGIQRNAEFIRK